jgi:hypothetical protein
MFKIGVVEFDCGHDSGGARYGDTSVYRVEIDPGCLYDANAMRWQLQGYKGKLVGVTWADDPMVDGIYRLEDVSVSPIQNYLATGRMSANVVLKRMPDLMEASYALSQRPDIAPSNYAIFALHGKWLGSDVDGFHVEDNGAYYMSAAGNTNGTPEGLPVLLTAGYKPPSGTSSDMVQVTQGCEPALFELGRATIEVDGGGGWWMLTGETVPEDHDVRIGNGLVRLTLLKGAAYILMELYDGTSWTQCGRYEMQINSENFDGKILRRFVVNRNDRAQVQLSARVAWGSQHRSYRMDFTVERGSGVVKIVFSRPEEALSGNWSIRVRAWDGLGAFTAASFSSGLRMAAFPVDSALFADTTGVVMSFDTVVYNTTAAALFGLGRYDEADRFYTETSLSDSSVY